MENRLQAFQVHGCDRPVVIWGTKEASWISYRLLRKLHIEAAAIGDNNAKMHGDYGIISKCVYRCKQFFLRCFRQYYKAADINE